MVSDSNVALYSEGFYEDSFAFDRKIKSVHWLDNGKPIEFTQNGNDVTITTEPYVYGRNLVVRVAKIICEDYLNS